MTGIFLQGGGAKGAFSAGVICALRDRGIEFDVISGTSIGAINGYYVYTQNEKKLKYLWTNMNKFAFHIRIFMHKVIDNGLLILKLRFLKRNRTSKDFYINYVSVKNKNIKEEIKNAKNESFRDVLRAVKYSSRLPYRINKLVSLRELYKEFDIRNCIQNFMEDVKLGVYEGDFLDGGILNNNFIEPFLKNKVDKLFLVGLMSNYEIDERILDMYDEDDIILIKPKEKGHPSDTLNFSQKYCIKLFNEGYDIASKIKLDGFR